jgi:hypothetical protein
MQGITRERGRGSDGKRNARTTQAETRAMYDIVHLLKIHERHIFETPLDERLDSQPAAHNSVISKQGYNSLYQVLVVQKGIQDARKQIREGVHDIRNFFYRVALPPGIQ